MECQILICGTETCLSDSITDFSHLIPSPPSPLAVSLLPLFLPLFLLLTGQGRRIGDKGLVSSALGSVGSVLPYMHVDYQTIKKLSPA